MALGTTYEARLNAASPAASTTLPLCQLSAGASNGLIIHRIEITNESSTTSGAMALEFVRSTATAPGTLTTTAFPTNAATGYEALNDRDANAAATFQTAGFSGALTGTQYTLHRAGANILNGYLYLPVPEERYQIPAGGFFWVRLPTAPAATYNVSIVFSELG